MTAEVALQTKKLLAFLRRPNIIICIEYGLLALVILLPLLKPGYIFALDEIWPPKIGIPTEITAHYPFDILLYLINLVLPTYILQKILMFLVLVVSGVGMHRLVPGKREWPKYFAGILYVMNPFVFQRFTAGHMGMLEAYALTPFLIKAFLDMLDNPKWPKALLVAVLMSAVFVLVFHNGAMALLFCCIAICVFMLFKLKEPRSIWLAIKWTGIAALMFLLLNSFWLVPFIRGDVSSAQGIKGFSSKDIIVFQSVADPKMGVMLNVAAMYGFWGENSNRFIPPKKIIPGWQVLYLAILLLAIWGLVVGIRRKEGRWRAVVFGVTGFVAYVLAVGVAHPYTAGTFWFLVKHVPYFSGFRDSQKFVALLVISYAYLGSIGVDDILARLEKLKTGWLKKCAMVVPALLLLIPVYYTYPMLWGFSGHLNVTPDYPRSWYQVNDFLNHDKQDFRVLFLPWHQYMHFSFTGKVIANPAGIMTNPPGSFFDKPVIVGDNMEFGFGSGLIYSESKNITSIFIEEKIISKGPSINDIGKRLLLLKVKYVVLAKESDYQQYAYLDSQKDLDLVKDTETLSVYLNKKWK